MILDHFSSKFKIFRKFFWKRSHDKIGHPFRNFNSHSYKEGI